MNLKNLEDEGNEENTKEPEHFEFEQISGPNLKDDVTIPVLEKLIVEENISEDAEIASKLLYAINDNPPWYTSLFLGMQHYLMMVETTVSIPYLLTPMMCMDKSDPARGAIASTIIFASGIITLMQTILGIRLPIVQGGTHTMLGPAITILALLPCPEDEILDAMSPADREETWQIRMRQIQGAICAAAIVQVVLGFTGLIGQMLRWVTPLVIVPTISLIGISLFPIAAEKAATNWIASLTTVGLVILFSLYMVNIWIPIPYYSNGIKYTKVYFFTMFPIVLSVGITWFFCFIFTVTDVLPENNTARTDLHLNVITEAPWFRIPYPGQWGMPTVTAAGFMGMFAGVISSIIESIGDYYACAKLSGAPPPPAHAMNRGVFIEGVGTIVAGLLGTGSGTSSYSNNVGAIAVTKVGSRRVVQYSAVIMIVMGIVSKVGACFIIIPEPIIGGLFFIVFGLITGVGLSSLQYVNLNSARNLFILGFSIFFGLTIPMWMSRPENENVIQTSINELDQVLTVILSTSMFVGGFIGLVLDNTVPGNRAERGLEKWETMLKGGNKTENDFNGKINKTYSLPFLNKLFKRYKWTRYIPVSPNYDPDGPSLTDKIRIYYKKKNVQRKNDENCENKDNS